jgi:hypothetical protein
VPEIRAGKVKPRTNVRNPTGSVGVDAVLQPYRWIVRLPGKRVKRFRSDSRFTLAPKSLNRAVCRLRYFGGSIASITSPSVVVFNVISASGSFNATAARRRHRRPMCLSLLCGFGPRWCACAVCHTPLFRRARIPLNRPR